MSNKTQLQTNNTALDALITRVNVAKDIAASLPEAGSGSGGSEGDALKDFLEGNLVNLYSDANFIKSHACQYDYYIETVTLPNVTYIDDAAFYGCEMLKTVIIPSINILSVDVFAFCERLMICDCSSCTEIGYGVFRNSGVRALLLRNTITIARLYDTATFNNTLISDEDGDGYIYVPRDMISSYQIATNWSVFANKFRAIEDYTMDGTIMGEFVPPFATEEVNATFIIQNLESGELESFGELPMPTNMTWRDFLSSDNSLTTSGLITVSPDAMIILDDQFIILNTSEGRPALLGDIIIPFPDEPVILMIPIDQLDLLG